jgi:hypothetical protein
MADSPRPPRRLRFQAGESQVDRNIKRGGYSHQSEKSAAKRTIVDGNDASYSRTIASPTALVRA